MTQKKPNLSFRLVGLVRCILVYDFPKAAFIGTDTAKVLITHIFDVTHDGGETNSYSSKFHLGNIMIFCY